MRSAAEPRRSIPLTRLALFAAIAVNLVGCSGDSSRISDPFGSARREPEATGSIVNKSQPGVASSRPLPAPPTAQMAPPATRPVEGGSPGIVSYKPRPAANEITGTVPGPAPQAQYQPQPPAPPPAARARWDWDGGTAVTVGPGDNGHTIAQRYGVPATVIAQANGLPDAAAIKPGQRLVIPRYDSQTTGTVQTPRTPAPVAAAVPPRPAPVVSAPATSTPTGVYVHVIAPGETLMKVSRQYKISLAALAAANHIPPHTLVKVGDRITVPGLRAPRVAANPSPPAAPPQRVAQQQPPRTTVVAPPVAPAVPPTANTITPAADNQVLPDKGKPQITASTPTFRWPVRGKLIAKTTGVQNDGINVSVPEGTPIKAAEDGVVAYAGSELKIYGNLVLIRHANGYVTAYAHLSEILVKRDEPIKRGQVIAKSGQTGNVTSPQVHFEIRKGSTPVDPIPYLDKGGTT